MEQQLPLTKQPNQTFQTTLAINGGHVTLNFWVYYNEMAQCWVMDIADYANNPLVCSTPLLTGIWPAANLLCQQGYLLIGAVYVLDASNVPGDQDFPDATNLATEYIVAWSDNPAWVTAHG